MEPKGVPPKVITFKPTSPLASSRSYSVTITTGVKDLAGNPLASVAKWSFTTGNQKLAGTFQPPTGTAGVFKPPVDTTTDTTFRVLSVKPVNGATGIPVTYPVTISFSKSVQPSTVSGTTFKLTTISIEYQGPSPFQIPVPVVVNVPGSVLLSPDGRTAIFDPAQPLLSQKTYTYMLTGVKDLGGNPLTPNPEVKGSFTTS
jgi:hypothetical protein